MSSTTLSPCLNIFRISLIYIGTYKGIVVAFIFVFDYNYLSFMRYKPFYIGISFLAVIVLWTASAAVESYAFQHGAFADIFLFGGSKKEVYLRLFVIALLFTIGAFLFHAMRKRNLALEAFRESNETLNTITAAAKDAIVMMDHQGIISFWNPAAEVIFGHKAHEAIGKELHTLLAPPRLLEQYRQGIGRFRDTGEGPSIGRTLELTAVRKDATEFPLELSLSSLQLKGKWHAVGVLRDISQRRRSEEELRTHREQLEHMVAERTEELNALNDLLRKEILDRMRTEEELYRSESFLNTIFDSFHDPFSIVDREFRYVRSNHHARSRNKLSKDLFGKRSVTRFSITGPQSATTVSLRRHSVQKHPARRRAGDAARRVGGVVRDHDLSHLRSAEERDPCRGIFAGYHFPEKEEAEKEDLIKTLNHLSTTDSLTGLLNRRALNDMLGHEIERSNERKRPFAITAMWTCSSTSMTRTAIQRETRCLRQSPRCFSRTLRKADILGGTAATSS